MAHKIRYPWLLALFAGAIIQAAAAQDAQDAPAMPQGMALAPGAPWWSSFQDSSLNLLLASAGRTAAPAERVRLQAAVTAEYISARYNTLRLITAQAIAGMTARRLELLKQDGGADDETMRQARQQAEEAADRVSRFEAVRSASVERLAQMLDGQSPRMLAAVLQPALEDSRLVVPTLDIPQQVPGVLLRRRADVAAAEATLSLTGRVSPHERLQFAQYVQALSSNIAPTPPGSTRAGQASDGGDIEQVLDSAREDVGHKLWQLKDCAEAAARAKEELDAADAEIRDAMAARDAGQLSELDELGTQARFLGAADRMAVAAGAVSLAWVAFQASIGGAGSGQLSAAADLR